MTLGDSVHAMTAIVSEELMDATWQHVGAGSAARVRAMQMECSKHQQELSGFVFGYVSSLSPEAIGLALYGYVVIYQAFKRSGVPLRKIRESKILRQWEATAQLLAGPQASGARLEIHLPSIACSEPVVLVYIADALADDQEDPVDLTDDEYWQIARVLLTVTECLHSARKRR